MSRDDVRRTPVLSSALGAIALAALAAAPGCGEDTPAGRDLASPAQREASPVDEEALQMDRKERAEEDREAFDLQPDEPREKEGFDEDVAP